MSNVVIIGATSAVAQEVAKLHAAERDTLILIGRNATRLEDIQNDLMVRGAADVSILVYDLLEDDKHDELCEQIFEHMIKPDYVYMAHGVLPDQNTCGGNYVAAKAAFNANCLSHISLLIRISTRLKALQAGTLAVISSVAGDRGRKSNYIYGSAKAMLSAYLQGLRNELFAYGVHVLDVKPGFIDTPMTADIEKKGALWATPQKVAEDIITAARKKKNTLYTPWFWFLIMTIIKNIPESIFKRLNL